MSTQKIESVSKDYLHFYDAPEKLSLQEKHMHGVLTNRHALTAIDLNRMLKIHPEHTIEMVPFNQASISAALSLTDPQTTQHHEPYTVKLLLNNGITPGNPAIHWMAASFTINPIAHTIDYTLFNPLNETDTTALQAMIETAIPSTQGWQISPNITTGSINPNDRHLSGYHALNSLAPLETNEQNTTDTDRLIQTFYKQQLEQLYIPRDIYNVLDSSTAAQFTPPVADNADKVTINEAILSNFLANIPTQAPIREHAADDSIVGDFIRNYQPDEPLMRFPSQQTNKLDAIQYEALFQQLSQIEDLSVKPVPRMVLTQTNNHTLDGLNAFYANHRFTLFNELQININLESSDNVSAFVSKLKFALNNLSRTHLKQLIITDERNMLTQEHIEELHRFIIARQLTVNIDLPRLWQTQVVQRELDRTIEENQQEKAKALLAGELAAQTTAQALASIKPRRQRKVLNSLDNVNIDIELQEGVEEDVVVESFKPKAQNGLEQDNLAILRLDDLKLAVRHQDLAALTQQEFANEDDEKALIGQWHKVFGHIVHGKTLKFGSSGQGKEGAKIDDKAETIGTQKVYINQAFHGITQAAFAKYNEHPQYFVDGINPYDLPSGFVLIIDPKHSDQLVLHYDKKATNEDTLLPALPTKRVEKPLSIALTNQLLAKEPVHSLLHAEWAKLNEEPYSREASERFRQSILEQITTESHPLLTLIPEPLANQLSSYALTDIEYNELLRIYDYYGVAGVEKIVTTWQTMDAKNLFPTIIKNVRQYESILLNNKIQNAIATIHGFPPEKRQWWDVLYAKHTPKDDDLCDLVQSFTQFIRKIEAQNLSFSALTHPETSFSTVHNMPMALSRMLSIVNLCDPRDKQLQWQATPLIDLSAQGALYALNNAPHNATPCGFVIPEMDVNSFYPMLSPAQNYKDIAQDNSDQERLKRFYHFLAHQPHRLPLAFYQEAIAYLEKARMNNGLPDIVVNQLYAMLLETTTGKNCRYFITDETTAKTQWQHIVDDIQIISMPVQTDAIKTLITGQLFVLKRLPALPILATLVRLITSPIHNLTMTNIHDVQKQFNRLEQTNAQLKTLTNIYESKLYLGMKFYSEDDYNTTYSNNRDLFEEHLAIGEQFNLYLQSNPLIPNLLIPLISTFKLTTSNAALVANAVGDITNSKSEFNDILLTYALECLQNVITVQGLDADKLQCFLSDQLTISLNSISSQLMQRKFELEDNHQKTPNEQEEFIRLRNLITQMTVFYPPTYQPLRFEDEHKATLFAFAKPFLHDVLEETFKDNFPSEYFNALKAGKASGSIAKRINEIFKASELMEAFDTIRVHYHEAETDKIIALLDTLEIILQRFNSQKEQLQMLEQLKNPQLLAAPIHEYQELLVGIAQHGHASFGYFMSIAGSKTYDNLTAKAHYFISEALPNLRDSTKKQLNEIDLATLAAPLVLAGKQDELRASINLNPVLTQLCATIITESLNLPNNIESFKKNLQTLEQIDPTINLTDLKRHLDSFQLPKHDTIGAALDPIQKLGEQSTTYSYAVKQTFGLIDELIARYPAAKSLLLPLAGNLLSTASDTESTHIKAVYDDLVCLHHELIALDNQDLVISLCEHFNGKKSAFKFGQLLQILKDPIFLGLQPNTKQQILRVICCLLNNDKPCSWDDIQSLIARCQDQEYVASLKRTFKTAPFPSLEQLNEWFDKAPKDKLRWEIVQQQYKTWSKQPVPREAVNGFKLAEAKKQTQLIQGIQYSDAELKAIHQAVQHAQTLDTETLLQQIKAIEGTGADNATPLTALMAELLYRTKGLEINTTQYLAVHAMLKAGGHVTSQIGTGEGKSRIMMLSIACQYALGKTVDFVTADVSLATRDYLEYQAFFKALGAETNLIMANTPASEYRINNGINFSDASNLSLFRNKARSEGLGDLVIANDARNRALLLDEADKTFFDVYETRLNYSAQANPAIRDMPWVYELMVEFFSIDGNRSLYEGPNSDADACNQKIKDFAKGKWDETQLKRLEAISVNQLEAWQRSALTALDLKYPQSFIIRPNITIVTKQGPQQVSQAKLVKDNNANDNGKLSAGVHQCLHARLNQERKQALANVKQGIPLSDLQQALIDERFNHPFFIDSENQIVYSSTNKALIDDYKEGDVLAVTGSAGSIKEREEAQFTHGKSTANMTFIDMPRHNGQNRVDLPVVLSKDKTHQRQNILSAIRHAIRQNQPILLICEDDEESNQLHKFLQQHLTNEEKQKLYLINADTPLDVEAEHVKLYAGQAGAITVSTAKLGRGTDIKLYDDAKQHGLCVLATYLPRLRDYLQVIGRSGRFGEKGTSQLILNREKLTKKEGVSDEVPFELYTATEPYLKHLQAKMDELTQKQRLIKDAVGDFRLALTNKFFNQFYTDAYNQGNKKDDLLRYWQVFVDKTDKAWNTTWPSISSLLAKEPIDQNEINALLDQYQITVQEEWKAMQESLQAQIRTRVLNYKEGEASVETVLGKDVGAILLTENAQALIYTKTSEQPKYTTIVAGQYDKAFIGRAVLYTKWIDNLRAFIDNFKSAWRGDSPWFPNLKAAQQGHMTWREFFFGPAKIQVTNESDIVEAIEIDSSAHIDELLPSTKKVVLEKKDDFALSTPYQKASTKERVKQRSFDDIDALKLRQKGIKNSLPTENNPSIEGSNHIEPH